MSAYRTKVEGTSGILNYWPLALNSGTAAKGAAATTLTNTGSVAANSGPLEKGDEGATSFNGTTAFGQTAEVGLEAATVTVEFWLYWTTNGTNDDFAMEYGTNANSVTGFNFDWNNSTSGETNAVSVKTTYGTSINARRYTFPRPTAAAWHHVVAVFTAAAVPVIYVDGVQQTITNREVANTQTGNFGKAKLNLMARNAASLFGEGRMAHVALFEGELSKATVEAHYAARKEEEGGGETVYTETVSGTISISGAMSELNEAQEAVSGVLTPSGASSEALEADEVINGTLALTGSVVEEAEASETVGGSFAVEGSMIEALEYPEVVAGEVVLSGTVEEILEISEAPTGNIEVTGTASEVLELLEALGGSMLLIGTKSETFETEEGEEGKATYMIEPVGMHHRTSETPSAPELSLFARFRNLFSRTPRG
ncbi:MAG: LamG-like jellyroll fold domain-containing protein [Solirubrobacterales bacterium]